jgi:hypothetical protein
MNDMSLKDVSPTLTIDLGELRASPRVIISPKGRRIPEKSAYGDALKVPKCEIFDLFDFNDFYVMKCL